MDVACAVKCLAEERYGLRIEIKHVYLHASDVMKRCRPQVVAVPFFYCSTDLAIGDYVERWPDTVFFNVAWEEIFYKGHLNIKAPSDDFARYRVIHHAWGDFYKQYLVEHGVVEENVFVNGNPAYQLYLSPYNQYYKDRDWLAQRYGLDKHKRWIFVPENYRWAFINDNTMKWRVSQGADLDELLEMREFARDSLAELLRWCNQMGSHPDLEIVFRPKPVTMLKEMEDFFSEHVGERRSVGLHFLKEESVREWILASDVVISSFSTTLIEAAIADKSIYMVEPLPISEDFSADWYDHVPRIRDWPEFEITCLDGSQGDNNRRLRTWAQNEMLARGDPISNLADFLHQLVKKPQRKNILRGIRDMTRGLRYLKKPDKRYFNPRTHENDRFDDDQVNVKLMEWRRVLGERP